MNISRHLVVVLSATLAVVAGVVVHAADDKAAASAAPKPATTGALSAQQINQYLTAERTAQARLDAMRAAAKMQQLRLQQTKVLASDDGVISSRSATVGAVLPAGQELFRLIRQGRLEWRAEVPAAELARLKVGMNVSVSAAGAPAIAGKLRMGAPTVDGKTRTGRV